MPHSFDDPPGMAQEESPNPKLPGPSPSKQTKMLVKRWRTRRRDGVAFYWGDWDLIVK